MTQAGAARQGPRKSVRTDRSDHSLLPDREHAAEGPGFELVIDPDCLHAIDWSAPGNDVPGWLADPSLVEESSLVPVSGLRREDDGSFVVTHSPLEPSFSRSLDDLLTGEEGPRLTTLQLLSLGDRLVRATRTLHENGSRLGTLRPSCVRFCPGPEGELQVRVMGAGLLLRLEALLPHELRLSPLRGSNGAPVALLSCPWLMDRSSDVELVRYLLRDVLRRALLPVDDEASAMAGEVAVDATLDPVARGEHEKQVVKLIGGELADLRRVLDHCLTGTEEEGRAELSRLASEVSFARGLLDGVRRAHREGSLVSDVVRARTRDREGLAGLFPLPSAPRYRSLAVVQRDERGIPARVEIRGERLRSESVFYLIREEEKGNSGGDLDAPFHGWEVASGSGELSALQAAQRGHVVLASTDAEAGPSLRLVRDLPPVLPGRYRLYSTSHGDTGLDLDVAPRDSGTRTRVDSIEPDLLDDPDREAVVILRGAGLATASAVTLERDGSLTRAREGDRYVRLRRVEGSRDEDDCTRRMVPPLSEPGAYRILIEGAPTRAVLRVAPRPPVFTSVIPETVTNEEPLRLRVLGRGLAPMSRIELVDELGMPARMASGGFARTSVDVVASTPESLEITVEAGVQPGSYRLVLGGESTGLIVRVLPRVEGTATPRLHRRGKRVPLRLEGSAFSPLSTYRLAARSGRHVELSEVVLDDGAVELPLPDAVRRGRYRVEIDGVETDAEVKIHSFSKPVTAVLSLLVLMSVFLGGLAGVPILFRPAFQRLEPAILHVMARDGRVLTTGGLELEGKHLDPAALYALRGKGDEAAVVPLALDGTGAGGSRLAFSPLRKLPPGMTSLELCVLSPGGDVRTETGLRIEMLPFEAKLSGLEGEGIESEGQGWALDPSSARGDLVARLTGCGLEALPGGSFLLSPGDHRVELRDFTEKTGELGLGAVADLRPGTDYDLAFVPGKDGQPVSLGGFTLRETIGFLGMACVSTGPPVRRLILHDREEEIFVWPREGESIVDSGLDVRLASERGRAPGSGQELVMKAVARDGLLTFRLPGLGVVDEAVAFAVEARREGGAWKRTGLGVDILPVPRIGALSVHGSGSSRLLHVGVTGAPAARLEINLEGQGLSALAQVILRFEGAGERAVDLRREEGGEKARAFAFPESEGLAGSRALLDVVSRVSGERIATDLEIAFFEVAAVDKLVESIATVDDLLVTGQLALALDRTRHALDAPEDLYEAAMATSRLTDDDLAGLARARLVAERLFGIVLPADRVSRVAPGSLSPVQADLAHIEAVLCGARPRRLDGLGEPLPDALSELLRGLSLSLDVVLAQGLDRASLARETLERSGRNGLFSILFEWDIDVTLAAQAAIPDPAAIGRHIADLERMTLPGDASLSEPLRTRSLLRGRLWRRSLGGAEVDLGKDLVRGAREVGKVSPLLGASLLLQGGRCLGDDLSRAESTAIREAFEELAVHLEGSVASALRRSLP